MREVAQYITNGLELLHKPGKPAKTIWKGDSIPFAACYGKIVYSTDAAGGAVKMLQSYIRLARDAAKAYNWTASTKLEALALPVKAALFAYVGQLGPEEVKLVERSVREPIALIQANATTEATGQQVLPLPQYGTRAPDISGYEIAGESLPARHSERARALQRAGSPAAARPKSRAASRCKSSIGPATSARTISSRTTTTWSASSPSSSINCLPFYDDTPKEVDTRTPDGKTKRVRINTPSLRAPDPAR